MCHLLPLFKGKLNPLSRKRVYSIPYSHGAVYIGERGFLIKTYLVNIKDVFDPVLHSYKICCDETN